MSRGTPQLTFIRREDPPQSFPPIANALTEPDGLLAVGGDLSEERLLYAYRQGIFPWFGEGEPILWWSPDPRCILRPERYHLSRSSGRALRRSNFTVSFNAAFDRVVDTCAEPRPDQPGTWITRQMKSAYSALHRSGWAHSVEVWDDGALAGGIYGISIGQVFFGESMFSRRSNGSKAALLALCKTLQQRGYGLLDCQVGNPHLFRMGGLQIGREAFEEWLEHLAQQPGVTGSWRGRVRFEARW